MILACCDHLLGTVPAHTSIPGWCDADVVLCPALQHAEIAAAVSAAAVVLTTHGVDRQHRVHDPWHAVIPGYRYDTGGTVDSGKVGHERTGS